MSKKETLIDAVCSQRKQMQVVIAMLIAMAVLLLFSLTTVRPGDPTFPLVVINAVLLGLSFAFFIGAYWYCAKRDMAQRERVREE